MGKSRTSVPSLKKRGKNVLLIESSIPCTSAIRVVDDDKIKYQLSVYMDFAVLVYPLAIGCRK